MREVEEEVCYRISVSPRWLTRVTIRAFKVQADGIGPLQYFKSVPIIYYI